MIKGFSFHRRVWGHSAWGFLPAEIDCFRGIAVELADFNAALVLPRGLRQAKRTHKAEYKSRRAALEKNLRSFGIKIADLHRIIQPAIVLREVWLWQMIRLKEGAGRRDGKYRRLESAIKVLSSTGPEMERRSRARLVKELHDSTMIDGFDMPNLALGWSSHQLRLLEKYGGPRILSGEELWEKQKYRKIRRREYAESKSRYWLPAMRVLSTKLLAQLESVNRKRERRGVEDLGKRDAYSSVYYFLNFLFPETFDKLLPRKEAAEFVRCRLIPPKSRRKPQKK